ncbi:DUF465 domain-containing protein [Breoghania sp.]|uniref:YdcH family protein n=1 Tax=Breoghania sp. TaxID=2065378 RepID=UPI0029CA2249|nr:DUF465 domain-containing protein [Breoghania sp.]
MTHVPHELQEEFPEAAEVLHQLKMANPHFQTLAERYAQVNHEIHLIESEVQPASDVAAEDLKKERLVLKDEIADLLRDAGAIG